MGVARVVVAALIDELWLEGVLARFVAIRMWKAAIQDVERRL
jgi:hypothetical protein